MCVCERERERERGRRVSVTLCHWGRYHSVGTSDDLSQQYRVQSNEHYPVFSILSIEISKLPGCASNTTQCERFSTSSPRTRDFESYPVLQTDSVLPTQSSTKDFLYIIQYTRLSKLPISRVFQVSIENYQHYLCTQDFQHYPRTHNFISYY